MTHLWEREHAYYGPEGSYWANWDQQKDYNQTFDSWADFIDEGGMSDADIDMNFIYRWDWHDWRQDRAGTIAFYVANGYPLSEIDGEYPNDFTLEFFWMMPRKGIMAKTQIVVTPEDEPAVIEWLTKYWDYMRGLWSPLSDAVS